MNVFVIATIIIFSVMLMVLIIAAILQDVYYFFVRAYINKRVYKRVYGLYVMGLIESGDIIMEGYSKKIIWWNNKIK